MGLRKGGRPVQEGFFGLNLRPSERGKKKVDYQRRQREIEQMRATTRDEGQLNKKVWCYKRTPPLGLRWTRSAHTWNVWKPKKPRGRRDGGQDGCRIVKEIESESESE